MTNYTPQYLEDQANSVLSKHDTGFKAEPLRMAPVSWFRMLEGYSLK